MNYNNILVGDDLIIKISLPNDITGNLTVMISNQTQVKLIDSNNIVFNFTNLKAGNYNIDLNYSGDDKYLSKEIINNVVVSKYQSFTNLTLSEINVDEDLILTMFDGSLIINSAIKLRPLLHHQFQA